MTTPITTEHPMKIVHFGDTHFEEAKHRRPGADGIDEGWHDVARAVDQIVDRAIELAAAGPVAAVFGGDLARSRKPSPQTYAHFGAAIRRMAAAGIPTIAIPGNHDIASNGEANALDPLAQVRGFHLFNEPGVAYLFGEPRDPLWVSPHRAAPRGAGMTPRAAIVMVPWMQRSVVAANMPAGSSLEQVLDAMSRAITTVALSLAADPIGEGIPTLLAYHGTVMGGETATGQLAHLFHEPVINATTLAGVGLSGVMLNHLHKRQRLDGAGVPVAYSSSVERLTFGDEHDTKGWAEWTVPTEAREPAVVEFGDTDARRFVTITDPGSYEASDDVIRDAIVRLRFSAEDLRDDELDPAGWEHAFGAAHRVTEVVIDAGDTRVEHAAADVARTDPIEALRDWLAVELPDDPAHAGDVLAAATELVRGEQPAAPSPVEEPSSEQLDLAPAV